MRDAMAHRGPDGAGLLELNNVTLAHRRLAVIDPTPAGAQPMTRAGRTHAPSAHARWAITYNGELYNEPELRDELTRAREPLNSASDTETLLATLARALHDPEWGRDEAGAALAHLRGMYAFALYDAHSQRLLLARDPLGVKPLYWSTIGTRELAFASEPHALFEHPALTPEPDEAGVSAYLTTIRTTLGPRTLFKGINTLPPGHALIADLSGPDLALDVFAHWRGPCASSFTGDDAIAETRAALDDSVRRHLRADVPTCALLSGGLDSTITSSIARAALPSLRTYCAGTPSDTPADDDLTSAQEVARALDTHHATAEVSRGMFIDRWQHMVNTLGVPLSTPNEVAINEVARRLRADGCVVTISGEGADELFLGYDTLLDAAVADAASAAPLGPMLLPTTSAWVPSGAKPALLNADAWGALDSDAALADACTREFDEARAECAADGLAAHARTIRRVNLTGLLARLDTATMLAGVEGRTPFADARIAELAESLDIATCYSLPTTPTRAPSGTGRIATAPAQRTKLVLREAYAGSIPSIALHRAKASFPLPFQGWMGDVAPQARESSLVRAWFTPAAIEAAIADPGGTWRLAWPLVNLSLWSKRWWG